MSEVKTLEEKNIVIGILNSLKKNSKYMYFDDMEFKASKDVRDVMPESIEFKVAMGTFSTSDYLILKEVHNLGITNPQTLLKRLAIQKKNHPERDYPCYSYNELYSRMRFLVRQGLLFSFEFIDSLKRSMFVFCCRMYGWRVYKNKLQLPDVYDRDVVFKAETEVFKRLASNAVAYSFALSPMISLVDTNIYYTYDERSRAYIYARASLGDTEKTDYIIEPIYFNIDNRVTTEQENENYIMNRLNQMEKVIQHLSKETNAKLILCVENYDGLGKLLKLIKTREVEFYINNCYYTSENVLFDSKDVLSRSFLSLYISGGKYVFGLAKDRWF